MTTKTDKRLEREQRMYDALRRIAFEYKSPDKLQRDAQREYGLAYVEALEYAYENIQALAYRTIKGQRRPA